MRVIVKEPHELADLDAATADYLLRKLNAFWAL
jgi:hypothetical protein